MPEIADLPAPRDLKKLLRQVITANEPVVVHDQKGHPVAALVPWEMFALVRRLLTEPLVSLQSEILTPEGERQAEEFATAMRASGVATKADPHSPATRYQSDPAWQQRWDALMAEFRRDTEGLAPEEIEAEIERVSEELRQERLARRS